MHNYHGGHLGVSCSVLWEQAWEGPDGLIEHVMTELETFDGCRLLVEHVAGRGLPRSVLQLMGFEEFRACLAFPSRPTCLYRGMAWTDARTRDRELARAALRLERMGEALTEALVVERAWGRIARLRDIASLDKVACQAGEAVPRFH